MAYGLPAGKPQRLEPARFNPKARAIAILAKLLKGQQLHRDIDLQ